MSLARIAGLTLSSSLSCPSAPGADYPGSSSRRQSPTSKAQRYSAAHSPSTSRLRFLMNILAQLLCSEESTFLFSHRGERSFSRGACDGVPDFLKRRILLSRDYHPYPLQFPLPPSSALSLDCCCSQILDMGTIKQLSSTFSIEREDLIGPQKPQLLLCDFRSFFAGFSRSNNLSSTEFLFSDAYR